MKNTNPLGLFDDHFLMEKLTKLVDPLQRLNDYIDWNIFKAPLDKAFNEEAKDRAKGGRPSFDKLLMFKALIIQSLYNLSDDQLEYQIVDRFSFKRFLGLKKDDKAFIAGFELGIQSVLHWFEQKMQPNGLMGKMDWWGALAWPRHYNNGEPPTIYEGNNTLYTLHYAYTLRHAADIFEYLGKKPQAAEYRQRAMQICESVNRLCKNVDGFYTESPDNKQVSQITNLLAILAEATTGDEAKTLISKLLEPKDWFGQVDLFLHLYLFEAMNKTGYQDKFMSELTEWQLMKDRKMSGFAEVPLEWGEENQRSECHHWSTAPNVFLFKTVCGINPTSAGHKSVEINPSFGELTQIKAVYPHPLGNIELDLRKVDSRVEGMVTIPKEMQCTFVWGSQKLNLRWGKQSVKLYK